MQVTTFWPQNKAIQHRPTCGLYVKSKNSPSEISACPGRSGPKRLGSGHCGVALSTPSRTEASTAVPHPRLRKCLSTLVFGKRTVQSEIANSLPTRWRLGEGRGFGSGFGSALALRVGSSTGVSTRTATQFCSHPLQLVTRHAAEVPIVGGEDHDCSPQERPHK